MITASCMCLPAARFSVPGECEAALSVGPRRGQQPFPPVRGAGAFTAGAVTVVAPSACGLVLMQAEQRRELAKRGGLR